MSGLTIRNAASDDAGVILQFVQELAAYEKAGHEVLATESSIRESIFSDDSATKAVICESDGQPVGLAVYFLNYSTWLAKHGLYLEDLYVTPAARGTGAGKAILKHLAQIAVKKNCGRFEWSVLDWNEPAIQFYQSLGAQPQNGWIGYRLTGQALLDLAVS